MQCLCRLLPIRTIELTQWDGRKVHAIDATNVDRPPARVKAWPAEGMNATDPASVVLGRHRVELVQGQFALTRGDAKALI
jgi:hypothetical protein